MGLEKGIWVTAKDNRCGSILWKMTEKKWEDMSSWKRQRESRGPRADPEGRSQLEVRRGRPGGKAGVLRMGQNWDKGCRTESFQEHGIGCLKHFSLY